MPRPFPSVNSEPRSPPLVQTALLVPCDVPDAIEDGLASGADLLVFDLTGAPADRPARRAAALAALKRAPTGAASPRRFVRIAPLPSGFVEGDLDAVMAGAPDGVVLPEAVGRAALEHLGAKLSVREAERRLPDGVTRIVALAADTGAGLLALGTLPEARRRLAALLWCPAALASDLGSEDPGCEPCRIGRTMLLAAAAACGVPAFEVAPDEGDAALGRRRDAARRDGFKGLLLRRPGQIRLLQDGGAAPRCAAARVDYGGPQL